MILGTIDLPARLSCLCRYRPIIYTTERHPEYASILEPVWESAKLRQIDIVTSELTLLEVLVLPIRRNDEELIDTYDDIFTDSVIDLHPISRLVLREAARLRATQNFKTPDAIHAATASLSNCDHLVSNDNDFRRLTTIDVTILSDLI